MLGSGVAQLNRNLKLKAAGSILIGSNLCIPPDKMGLFVFIQPYSCIMIICFKFKSWPRKSKQNSCNFLSRLCSQPQFF